MTSVTYGTTSAGGFSAPSDALLMDQSAAPSNRAEDRRWQPARTLVTAAIMAGMLVTAFVAFGRQHAQQARSLPSTPRLHHTPNLATTTIDFTISNEYTGTSGESTSYMWLEGLLVEPHRTTLFQVSAAEVGTTYGWTITSKSGKTCVYEGETVTHTFTELGLHSITLMASAVSSDGAQTSRQHQKLLVCKYVRREIRSLLAGERQELLNAMSVLWKVKKEKGQQIYGEDYVDIWSINLLHYRAASDQDCDHFHDGMAFVVAHSAVTLIFEQSLRLVNPKLSVPYWDFTIEGTAINLNYDGDFNRLNEVTPMFTNEYFGGADPDDLMVKDGLWGYTAIPMAAEDEWSVPNVYGMLRSPWDADGRPFLTRGLGATCGEHYGYYSWPTCKIHYNLNVQKASFYAWTWTALYNPHGTVHIWIGGMNDCKETFDELAEITGDRIANDLRPLSFVHRKNIYRQGYWGCEGTVSQNTTAEEVMDSGVCGCLDYDLEDDDDVQHILNTIPPSVKKMTGGLDREQKRAVAKALCEGVQSTGDQLESSSPLDPSFWPTHPAMERLFQKAQLSGVMTDNTWPSQGTWTGTNGKSYTVRLSLWGDACHGHHATDIFPYDLVTPDELTVRFDLMEGGVLVRKYNMTNVELLRAMSPRSNSLPYVYDNMDWTHCMEEGYDFSKMGSTTSGFAEDTYQVFESGEDPLDWNYERMAEMMSKSK